MKMINCLSAVSAVAVLVTQISGPVFAEDDNVYDGKGYNAAFCAPVLGDLSVGSKFIKYPFVYANTSGMTQAVVCPIVQDSWQSTRGLSYARIWVQNNSGGEISCSINSYTLQGDIVESQFETISAAGSQNIYFFNEMAGVYLGKTAAEGNMGIICSLGPDDWIRSYVVQERS